MYGLSGFVCTHRPTSLVFNSRLSVLVFMLLLTFRDFWKEGGGGDPNYQCFAELTVPSQAAEVVGTQVNCAFSLYNSGILSTTVSFWTLRMRYYFYKVFFLCVISILLHVHFTCTPV